MISDDAETPHLTPEEVITLLRFVETCRPIIVGGQSINIWAELYYGRNEELDQLGPLTSKDLDFFHNRAAERSLAESLENGQLRVPTGDEHTPSAALVTGTLGGREIVIDFMAQIKGVEDQSILENSITFADADDPTSVSITLMHPMDCVRSRLSNINTLGRTGEHSITQATASLLILDCYIDDQLNAKTRTPASAPSRLCASWNMSFVTSILGRFRTTILVTFLIPSQSFGVTLTTSGSMYGPEKCCFKAFSTASDKSKTWPVGDA